MPARANSRFQRRISGISALISTVDEIATRGPRMASAGSGTGNRSERHDMKLGKARFVAAVAPLALAGLAFAVPAMAASSASAQTAAPAHAAAALVRVPAVTFDPAQEAIHEIA